MGPNRRLIGSGWAARSRHGPATLWSVGPGPRVRRYPLTYRSATFIQLSCETMAPVKWHAIPAAAKWLIRLWEL